MPPARRPALSCDVPSVADTVCACCDLKVNGSAPYLSCWARSFALDCVKLPVIEVGLVLIACSFTGAEITRPSSVKPTKSAHGVAVLEQFVGWAVVVSWLLMLCAEVYLPQEVRPLSFNVSRTD